MKEEMDKELNSVEEKVGLSASASNNDAPKQNQVNQATDSCGIVSTDTTVDTTPKRPWLPGPWKAVTYGDSHTVDAKSSSPPVEVCEVLFSLNKHGENMTIGHANARLIAAAPDLFEALAELLEAVEGHCDAGFWTDEIANARAAMDKALGVNGG